jgi:hypothetical protein
MGIVASSVLTVAAILGSITTIFGLLFAVYRWYLKIGEMGVEIRDMKKENTMLCYTMSACLDGLIQLGANHEVPKAKDKLDKYLNMKAHE